MKRYLILFMAVAAAALSCNKEQSQPPLPELTAVNTAISFEMTAGTVPVTINANRSFKVVCSEDWLAFDPDAVEVEPGETSQFTINVTALPNPTGNVRTATVVVKSATHHADIAVTQALNPDGMPTDLYSNNFDKTRVSSNTDASGSDAFRNEQGTAVTDNLTYYGSSTGTITVSIRTSGSSSSGSIYTGSGNNNVFFRGAGCTFVIGKLALHKDHRGLILKFAAERNEYGASTSVFNPAEFPVRVSVDGSNWVSVDYTFAAGSYPDNDWDLATARFTLPEQASELYIMFEATVGSIYRLDDVSLTASDSQEGEIIDWNDATAISLPTVL